MGRTGLLIAAALTLAGCAAPPAPTPDRLETGDEIRFGVSGSIHGGAVTSIYPNDQAAIESWSPGQEGRREIRELPEGTFARLLPLARDGIAAVPPHEGAPCMDYGTDFVEVTVRGVTRDATAPCPAEAMAELQSLLSDAVAP